MYKYAWQKPLEDFEPNGRPGKIDDGPNRVEPPNKPINRAEQHIAKQKISRETGIAFPSVDPLAQLLEMMAKKGSRF